MYFLITLLKLFIIIAYGTAPVILAGIALPGVVPGSRLEEEKVILAAPARIRSLFPETWLWDIVTMGWVGTLLLFNMGNFWCTEKKPLSQRENTEVSYIKK